jgi:outer membrane immunogenic protein
MFLPQKRPGEVEQSRESVNKSLTSSNAVPRRLLHFGDGICSPVPLYLPRGIAALALRKNRLYEAEEHRDQTGETTMKKFLLGTAGLVVLGMAAPAMAADLPARTYTKAPAYIAAVYDWSGFYIGANAGWGNSRNCWTNTAIPGGGVAGAEGCHDANGGVAGGQIGYRWQTAAWVFGLEAQGDWAGLSGSNPSTAFVGITNQTKVNAFGLFTGQVGYAWNNALLYVKGGAAVAADKYTGIATVLGTAFDSAKDTRWGGTVGAGVEYGFTPNWSVGVEYDHMFMGRGTENFTTIAAGVPTRTDSISQNVDLITARINYRWGGPVIAKY